MIDTLEFGYMGSSVGEAELRAFLRVVPGGLDVRSIASAAAPELRPVQWSGEVPQLGRVALNADGYVRLGGSLAKFRQRLFEDRAPEHLSNDELLTADQVNETFQAVTVVVESLLPFVDPPTLNVTRADVVYQRRVESSLVTLNALRGAMVPTRKGCAWFDNGQGVPTGLMLQGRSVAHRVYDKGLESGQAAFLNHLRSEEQLRKGSAGFGRIWNGDQRRFDREACRDVLNERYLDVAYGGEVDVSRLILEDRAELALYVLHPELFPIYKRTVKKSAYYDRRRKVREFRASAIPDDLRVPEDAWLRAA